MSVSGVVVDMVFVMFKGDIQLTASDPYDSLIHVGDKNTLNNRNLCTGHVNPYYSSNPIVVKQLEFTP